MRIDAGEEGSEKIPFPGDLFRGWVDLLEDTLYLHFISSHHEGQGHVQDLIEDWLSRGYDVRIVQPNEIMQHILKKFDFVEMWQPIPEWYGSRDVCVWRKK